MVNQNTPEPDDYRTEEKLEFSSELRKKNPRFPEGSDLTAKEFIEMKRAFVARIAEGQQSLVDPGEFKADYRVPLTADIDGEHRVIGDAEVESTPEGLMVKGRIDVSSEDLITRGILGGMSFGFRYGYPSGTALSEENKPETRS